MGKQEKANVATGRYDTDNVTKRVVWTQAAGHCELCGTDLMYDYRAGKPMNWGEVAHMGKSIDLHSELHSLRTPNCIAAERQLHLT